MAKPPLTLKKPPQSDTLSDKMARLEATAGFAEKADQPREDDPRPWLSANPSSKHPYMVRFNGPEKSKIDYAVGLLPNGTSKHAFILESVIAAAERIIAAEEARRAGKGTGQAD